MRRFFADKVDGNTLFITGTEASHAINVIRLGEGDELIAIYGGYEYIARIKNAVDGKITAEIEEKRVCGANPKINMTLYFSYLKSDNSELVVQKATELGVSSIYPFISKNSVKIPKDATKALERLRKISDGAIKQCGRTDSVNIGGILSFSEMTAKLGGHELVIFAYEKATFELKKLLSGFTGSDIAVIIGCEGGFTEDEAEKIVEAGGKAVSLGSRILRGETAAISACAVVAYETGC